jgi:peptidyl-prolyl cis-trans isomerase C
LRFQLFREPFVHFLGLGALLFALYYWVNPAEVAENDENRIVIDQADLDHLTNMFKLQWKADPSPSDLAAIIDRHLRQEVFYREALKMNLDHNDSIIKRRLAQKMEAVANDLSTLMQPPTDEQLRAYFESRQDFFMLPKAYAFKQILFLPDEQKSIEPTLASLQQGATIPEERRNKLSVPVEWSLTSIGDLENAFGSDFSRSLNDLAIGEWSGPIKSGYGWHLIFIERKEEARVPDFDDVKEYVAREYEYRTALDTQDKVYQELLVKYDVDITADNLPEEVEARFAK